jgi:hypothetical protein
MTQGGSVGPTLRGKVRHHTITQVAGGGLQRFPTRTSLNVEPPDMERNLQIPAQGFHKLLIGFGLDSSQAVIAVDGRQGQGPGWSQLMEQREQRH